MARKLQDIASGTRSTYGWCYMEMSLKDCLDLICRCLTQMGTDKEDFIELTERIGRKTGGVGVSPFTSDIRGQDDPASYLIIRGKAVADKVGDLTDLFVDVLHNAKLDDQARFKQVGFDLDIYYPPRLALYDHVLAS